MQSPRDSMPQNGSSPAQGAFERDRVQAQQIAQEAASDLYGLLQHQHQHQQNLPPVGLFAVGGTHPHPHPNTSSTKRKRVDFVDLTSDSDSPREKRPRLSPPKRAPPQPSPAKRNRSTDTLRKQQQLEQKAADEQLERKLQAAEVRKGKAQRLRSKPNSPEKRPGKKLSVYEEFQKIQQEAAQGEPTQTRKRTLRSASPEKTTKPTRRGSTSEERRASKRTHRTLRNNSPEKQPQEKLSVYEEFQKIEREASQQERPSKKLSVYEEFQRIEREAAQGKTTQTRKRVTKSANPEKSTTRLRRGRTPEERRASKQTTRVDMDPVSTEEMSALQQQLHVQARATASAESDRHKMPPPPPPKNSTGHPMVASQPLSGQTISKQTRLQPIDMFVPINPYHVSRHRLSSESVPSGHINGPREAQFRPTSPFPPNNAIGHSMVPSQPMSVPVIPKHTQPRSFSTVSPFNDPNVSRTYSSNENGPYQTLSGPCILKKTQSKNAAYHNHSGQAMPRETQSRPFSPFDPSHTLNAERSRPSNETLLHQPQNARVTKQSYHTAHKLPYSTQEIQHRAQLQEAELRAQERVRREQQEKEDYIHKYTRHSDALQCGVHMSEVELNHIPFSMCEYFASADYRYGHLPRMNPNVAIPSVENFVDLTGEGNGPGVGAGFAGTNNNVSRDVDAASDAVGLSNAIDLTNEPYAERELTPLFDTPVPHNMILNEYELPPIVPDELNFTTPFVGQPGIFLEPVWDEKEGCWRAPSPGMTQELANVVEVVRSVKYINEGESGEWYRPNERDAEVEQPAAVTGQTGEPAGGDVHRLTLL
ncbi:hypothetical protein PMIN03_003598 [Paraphaeosphaeria minitans]|uniref:Uncharacterized protein n=1 Tax=Paraphaeosphaeria minitans TaxID=565426 RepID=A0A9P6GLF0_9PLEO|nr:hypothetical protein PMIN01_05027 [Paraphaeosphaeria minitans]